MQNSSCSWEKQCLVGVWIHKNLFFFFFFSLTVYLLQEAERQLMQPSLCGWMAEDKASGAFASWNFHKQLLCNLSVHRKKLSFMWKIIAQLCTTYWHQLERRKTKVKWKLYNDTEDHTLRRQGVWCLKLVFLAKRMSWLSPVGKGCKKDKDSLVVSVGYKVYCVLCKTASWMDFFVQVLNRLDFSSNRWQTPTSMLVRFLLTTRRFLQDFKL